MKKERSFIALLLVFVMLAALFSGCTPAEPDLQEQQQDHLEDTQTTGEKKRTVVIANRDEITDFDPFRNQQTVYACLINRNCMETLLVIDQDMDYAPALATSWEITEDGLGYTFHLREGVKFHDGSDFTAEDVKFTIEYTKDPNHGCWRADYFANVQDIACPDPYTVTLTLDKPAPAMLDTCSNMVIVSENQDPSTYSTTLNGTGPFKFVSYTSNDAIVFEKNPNFWDAANVKLEGLTIKYVADETTAFTGMQAGDIDLIYGLNASYADSVSAANGLEVVTSPTSNSTYLFEIGLHNVEAFREPGVLKAMFMCLDTQSIADDVFYGYATPSKGPVHAGAKYYKPVYDIRYDVEAAKELLATTKYADGFSFKMYCMSGTYEDIAVVWKQDLAKIGIDMDIQVQEMSVWLEHYLSRDYEMISNAYSMVGTDPATLCTLIIASLYDYQASETIIPGLRERIDEAASTTNDAQRENLYGQIFDLLAQYMPIYTYLCVDNLYAKTENLKGVSFNGEARYTFTYAYYD